MTTSKDKRLAQIRESLPSVETLFRKCFDGKASPRAAIKAVCIECMGFDKLEAKKCTNQICPLWHHRPFQSKRVVASENPGGE